MEAGVSICFSRAWRSDWIPRGDEIALNLPSSARPAQWPLVIGFIFGLFPAWRATRVDGGGFVTAAASKGSAGLPSVRLRSALVVAQIALTLVLLVCAGLVRKSFAAIMRVNPGMQIENTLSMVLTLAPTQYDTGPKRSDYYQRSSNDERGAGNRVGCVHPDDAVHLGHSGVLLDPGFRGRPAKLPPTIYDSVSPSYFDHAHPAARGPDLYQRRQ